MEPTGSANLKSEELSLDENSAKRQARQCSGENCDLFAREGSDFCSSCPSSDFVKEQESIILQAQEKIMIEKIRLVMSASGQRVNITDEQFGNICFHLKRAKTKEKFLQSMVGTLKLFDYLHVAGDEHVVARAHPALGFSPTQVNELANLYRPHATSHANDYSVYNFLACLSNTPWRVEWSHCRCYYGNLGQVPTSMESGMRMLQRNATLVKQYIDGYETGERSPFV